MIMMITMMIYLIHFYGQGMSWPKFHFSMIMYWGSVSFVWLLFAILGWYLAWEVLVDLNGIVAQHICICVHILNCICICVHSIFVFSNCICIPPSHLFAWKVLFWDVNDMQQEQLQSKPTTSQIHFDQNFTFSLSATFNTISKRNTLGRHERNTLLV